MKKLYNLRSKALHGAPVDIPQEDRRDARILASATLLVAIERRKFRRKAGYDDEKPSEFLKDLRRYLLSGQSSRVSESPATPLWRGYRFLHTRSRLSAEERGA